jgi:hypothetical protein
MKRSALRKHPPGSLEYIVLHARFQRSKGKNPSVPFGSFLNPREVLKIAQMYAYFSPHDEYLQGKVPSDYVCVECGATNCKLWREYNTFASKLLCAVCASNDQKKNIDDIDSEGKRSFGTRLPGFRTDQIGWFVPAVPTEEGGAYWGYTSVPRPGCEWWYKLPTLPARMNVPIAV